MNSFDGILHRCDIHPDDSQSVFYGIFFHFPISIKMFRYLTEALSEIQQQKTSNVKIVGFFFLVPDFAFAP